MLQRNMFCLIMVVLISAIAFTGCTSQQAAPVTPTAAPTAIPTPAMETVSTTAASAAPATTLPVATKEVTREVTKAESKEESGKVILTTKGLISPGEFKAFDFKAMGDQFSTIGTKYKISLKADKPIIGYAVTRSQADVLQGSAMIPQYVPSSEKIQWGLITPYMNLGKTTDSTQTFTIETVNPYVYVIDARWMQTDNDYKSTAPFNYEITITKITTPVDPNAATAHT